MSERASRPSWRELPVGRRIELPGRGSTWATELAGPTGAPTLLLLHGWVATAALNWHAVFAALGQHYRVIASDHRGHGRGVRPRGRFRLADCADDAAALLAALGVEKAIAVGYSMGGPIAQLLWHRHRERVAGLVFCATAGSFRRPNPGVGGSLFPALVPGLAFGTRLVPGPLRRRLVRDFLASRIRNPEALEWVTSEVADHDFGAILQAGRAITAFDASAWLGSIDVPTAVVVTERDELVSPKRQRKLAASIPGATVHACDGDHGACAYRPREFAAALLDACESVVMRGRQRAAS